MTEIQLKAAFEKESKLFLSEFQKPDCFHSANCTEHVCDVMKRHLGNINYGYFGKHCNFPDSVLIAAGGVAQFLAGTSEFENWYVFLDDPRDTYRVMQGIEIYEEEN